MDYKLHLTYDDKNQNVCVKFPYEMKEELQHIPKVYDRKNFRYILSNEFDIPILLKLFKENEIRKDDSFENFYNNHFLPNLRKIFLIQSGQGKNIINRELLEKSGLKDYNLVRDYQLTAITFAYYRKKVLIADEMGLGKCLTSLAVTLLAKNDKSCKSVLIVCPNSTKKSVWEKEIKKWTNESHIIYESSKKMDLIQLLHENFYTIINYEAIRKVYNDILSDKINDLFLIVDECHFVKNRKALQTGAIKSLSSISNYLLLLSGTPILNAVDDLWSIMDCINTNLLGKYWDFVNRYCILKEKRVGPGITINRVVGDKNMDELKERMAPYYIRRTKDEVLKELPEKIYKTYTVDLYPKQREIWKYITSNFETKINNKEIKVDKNSIKNILIKLLQLCDTTYGFCDDEVSSKLDLCIEIIKEIMSEHKIVVFTWFVNTARVLKKRLDQERIECVQIDGETSIEDRSKYVKKFQEDKNCRVFIATIATCGLGLDLYSADVCIFVSRSWTPKVNEQAEDRVHRLGQKKAVNIINIVTNTYVEEKMLEVLEKKEDLFQRIFEEGIDGIKSLLSIKKGGEDVSDKRIS